MLNINGANREENTLKNIKRVLLANVYIFAVSLSFGAYGGLENKAIVVIRAKREFEGF